MSNEPSLIPSLIGHTFRDPRGAGERVLRLGLPPAFLWQALALVIVMSALLVQLTAMLAGGPTPEEMGLPPFVANPLLFGVVQGCLLVLMVFAVHWVGRTFGGSGEFEGALALVIWLQFLLLCLQVLQIALALLLPPLAGIVTLVGLVAFFWLLTQFICVLHGFRSAGMVFVMIFATMLAFAFALSILLAIVGVMFLGETPDV